MYSDSVALRDSRHLQAATGPLAELRSPPLEQSPRRPPLVGFGAPPTESDFAVALAYPGGAYTSIKNNKKVIWSTKEELWGIYHAEVRPDVISYYPKPHALDLEFDGKIGAFIPTREDDLADGRIEIVEIRTAAKAASDPYYNRKLAAARKTYEAIGWSFRVMDESDVLADPRFSVVEQIQSYRLTIVTAADVKLVLDQLNQDGRSTLGRLKAVFSNPALGMAKVYAMAVRRLLIIDLDRGLEDDTPVLPILGFDEVEARFYRIGPRRPRARAAVQ